MEHTDYDIKNIDFANRQLDNWINDEDFFNRLLLMSKPLRWVLGSAVFATLHKLGEIVPLEKLDPVVRKEYQDAAIALSPGGTNYELFQISRCLLVISTMAEKRLKKTSGL